MSLLELFCHVDDFCQAFEPSWQRALLQQGGGRRRRSPRLSTSEIMTIVIHFHQSHYRDFKTYYLQHVLSHLRDEFPCAVSYTRFVELCRACFFPSWPTFRVAAAALVALAFHLWTQPR